MALTVGFLKYPHLEELPIVGRSDFKESKMVSICELYANQESIDEDTLSEKLSGRNLSDCYVLSFNGKLILLDGHHTTIAKKLRGQTKIKAKFLSL